MKLVNFNHRFGLIIMLYDFAERKEQVSETIVLITFFMMQIPSTKFCLHLLINFRVQTRLKKNTQCTHRALFITRIFDSLCAHSAHKYQQGRAIWKRGKINLYLGL